MSTKKTPMPNVVADHYIVMNVVGSGQFGDVYKAKRIDKEEFYAVKSIELNLFDNMERLNEMADSEASILSKINNPNVIKLIETVKTKTHHYTVYELCTGGNLEDLLDKRKYLPEKEAFHYFRQILNGFRPLVALNIMHRDIKPANILLHENVAKIADFGFCKPLSNSFEVTETMIGSPIYMAPEILKGQTYSIKADIYSMGVMLYEMLFGKAPFEAANIPALLNMIIKGDLLFPPYNKVSPATEYLLKRMLEPIETQRIDWEELFQSFQLPPPAPSDDPALGGKIDIDIIKELNSAYTAINEKDTDLLLGYFTKECKQTRDKILYLWRTFSQGYDNIISEESHIINYLVLKKLGRLSKDIEKILKNTKGTMSRADFDIVKQQFDYTRLSVILKNEVEKFEEALSIYKNYIQTISDSSKPDGIANDPALGIGWREETYEARVLAYGKTLKEELKDENREATGGNLALYLNLLLDCIMISEMYESFFEISTPFNEQPYLQNLFDMEQSELLELADEKIRYLETEK